MLDTLKRIFVGRPLASSEQEHQRLTKKVALAVFSSDAISSTAYATEEILFVTAVGAGTSLALGLDALVPIAIGVAALLAIVITSYRQTIYAYPKGGAAYVVSRENHGELPSLVAGASILVDYILTVAVSVSAGVAAIISIPTFHDTVKEHRVEACLILVLLVSVANLRGIKESGRVFAVPVYGYIAMVSMLIFLGLTKHYLDWFGGVDPVDPNELAKHIELTGGSLGLFLILKGFSSGAVALTGVEAIADGVPAFRRPEAKNAARTLTMMGIILGSLFLGVSVLASKLHPVPNHDVTVFSQMGEQVFGDNVVLWVLQILTAGILTLAANTAYADFPRLSSVIARDGYLPRQLAARGDRLVFSNGIVVLAVMSSVLLVAFGGVTTNLIPLYAVGVFLSFTLSQSGMVRHHLRHRDPGWKLHATISGVGATATFIVLMVVGTTKFVDGAWIPLVVIPAIVLLFKAIKGHYNAVAAHLAIPPGYKPRRMNHTVVVLVGGVHRGVMEALAYAKSLAPNHLVAMTIVSDEEEQERIEAGWAERRIDVPLEIVHSPYRELTRPVMRFVDELDARYDDDVVTIIIPEFVVTGWWAHLLHNQSALFLKGRLLFRKGTVVTSVPYHVDRPPA
ncbi:MAG: APC family permease [Actinomycetota bacterium]